LATALYESATGKFIKTWYAGGVVDVGRGMAAPLDLGVKGYQLDSTQPGIFDCKGNQLYANSFFPTEPLWWDSDLCREYLRDDTTVRISKFNVGYYDLPTLSRSRRDVEDRSWRPSWRSAVVRSTPPNRRR